MGNFGEVPKGAGFGIVPKFVFRLTDLKPGPKALYASLCTNANKPGQLWRSLDRLAQEFGVTRRQIQRWLNDLEAAGLLVRFTKPRDIFLVIRNEAGTNWARSQNLKAVSARRLIFAKRGREGARKRWEAATSASPPKDTAVAAPATPMSPKHDLQNKIPLTKEVARQERGEGPHRAQSARPFGLKRIAPNPNAELIQEQLNQLVFEVGGWDVFAALPPEKMVELLSGRCVAGTAAREILAALGL